MANEYRIVQFVSEVAVDPLGDARIYETVAEVAHDGDTNAELRVYSCIVEAVYDLQTGFAVEFLDDPDVVFDDFIFSAPFQWDFIPGSAEVPEGFGFSPAKFLLPDRERNPYASHTSDDPRFFQEQQRTVRDQHNRTQAGDTSFDYGLLLRSNPDRLYTLGSLGRFYHDDFGVILARYVRFRDCVDTATQGAPVGYFSNSESVDWTVTNDLSKSSADQVMGVMCLNETPHDNSYGWVVTEGAIPVNMQQATGIIPAPETPYVWSGTGEVDIDVSGKILGRRWGRAISPVLAGGTLFVRLEGMSPAWFSEWLTTELTPIYADLTALDQRLVSAESAITILQTTSATHTQQIATLDQRITLESQARARDVAAIRSEMSAIDWAADIAAGDNAVRAEYRAADEVLRVRIEQVALTANQAYQEVNQLDITNVNLQLSGLNAQMGNLYVRLENFTVVNPTPTAGTVLMQMVAGTVYTFEPVDFILENLADVDTTTSPPADDDVLTWVAANSKWEPKPAPGAASSGILYASGTSTNSTATTAEQDLKTFTLLGNTLANDGECVRVTYGGSFASNARTKTLTAYFGTSGNVTFTSSASTQVHWLIEIVYMRTSSNTLSTVARSTIGIAGANEDPIRRSRWFANTQDLTTNKDLKVTTTVSAGAAAADTVCSFMLVEYVA